MRSVKVPRAVMPTERFGYSFCLIFFLIGMALQSYCQQGNVWYFGHNAGITFNTDPPTPLLDGKLFTFEGCSGISDRNGQLLFYTDGATVWNKLHQVMFNGNGLKGQLSSSNAAIVIPKPGADSIYYIFTSGSVETGNEGYFFSEVDMSLQGGLGAVTNKNIFLYGNSTEKITAVRHSNGVDVWVITKALGNTLWHVFKVDCNGVHTNAVISNAGYLPDLQFITVNVGYLRASPDGTKIASINTVDGVWELLQFDAGTGVVSNGLVFPLGVGLFGAEFSPDSKLLYIGVEDLPFPQNGVIYQYNLATYDAAAIAASQLPIGNSAHYMGALQLGPDNKIYCALGFSTFLGVIHAPNVAGMGCDYVDKQIDLQGREVFRGLPVYFPGLITNKNADFSYTISANCATVNFVANTTLTGNTTWQWDFGDGTIGTGQAVSHTYTAGSRSTGIVTLTVSSPGICGAATAIKKIHIDPNARPVAFAGNDTTVAIGQPVQLHATGGQHYQWSPPDFLNTDTVFNPVVTLNNDQRYQVKVTTAAGCEDTDEIFIKVFKRPDIHVPNAFTPEGNNKIFRPVLAGIQQLYYFSVYNRYGQLVFTTAEPGKGWDGRINGVVQPTGTYVWMIKAKDYQGKLITKNGTVLLIR